MTLVHLLILPLWVVGALSPPCYLHCALQHAPFSTVSTYGLVYGTSSDHSLQGSKKKPSTQRSICTLHKVEFAQGENFHLFHSTHGGGDVHSCNVELEVFSQRAPHALPAWALCICCNLFNSTKVARFSFLTPLIIVRHNLNQDIGSLWWETLHRGLTS